MRRISLWAGLSLAVGAVGWAAGAWYQGHDTLHLPRYRLVEVGAVVEAAGLGRLREVGHQAGQHLRRHLPKSELLEAGGIDQPRPALGIEPVPLGGGGGVASAAIMITLPRMHRLMHRQYQA